MDTLQNPIQELIQKYKDQVQIIEIDQETRDNEIKSINDYLSSLPK